MSAWTELPRPATPGPWGLVEERTGDFFFDGPPIWDNGPDNTGDPAMAEGDARAIAALPDYVAEVDRLRAWVEQLASAYSANIIDLIHAGEWPEGSKP